MKLKEAYGHPSYNKLIKAYHSTQLYNYQLSILLQKVCRDWMREKTDCERCTKAWS